MRWPRARPSGSRRPHVRRLLRGNDPDSCRAHLAEGGPGSGAVETLRPVGAPCGRRAPSPGRAQAVLECFRASDVETRTRGKSEAGRGPRRGSHTRGRACSGCVRPAAGGGVCCSGWHVRRSSPAPAPPAAWLREAFPLAAPPTPGCSGTHCRSSETKSSSSVNAAGAARATVAVRTVGKATGRHHG